MGIPTSVRPFGSMCGIRHCDAFSDCGSKAWVSAASWRELDIGGQPLEVPSTRLEAAER